MDIFLQIWGGGFYLLNKIFFSIAENKGDAEKRKCKIIGWSVYIIGVPAWIFILIDKHNWIATSMELGGIPAMLFGLYNVVNRADPPNKLFDFVVSIFTYSFVLLGVSYSFYAYGGINSVTQFLEIGVTVGFLVGGYLLAKNSIYGWLFFILMNVSMGSLLLIQEQTILAVQQAVSLCFVIYGLRSAYYNVKK